MNAQWIKEHKVMLYGDTDRYPASLDVTAHEFTHGVTGSVGDSGVLDYQNQSGALNEAFSDIFGEMVEARTQAVSPDWIMGSILNTPFRNMSSPSSKLINGTVRPYPAKMSEFIQTQDSFLNLFQDRDYGGVHFNSSIINRCYYLLAQGLPEAIGLRNAECIFYRALTQHMHRQSQFVDARLGCIAAAKELFGGGSFQGLKVAEAFDAVEIFADPVTPTKPPSTRPAVSAPDSTLYIQYDSFWGRYNLGRLETALDGSVGTTLVTSVKKSRTAVTGDGADMVFVGADHSLCTLPTAGGTLVTNFAGSVHSVTLSPTNRYVAFVLRFNGLPSNQIYLYDYQLDTTEVVNLVTPVTDGPPIPNISYADSMDFSSDGSVLIYDALSVVRQPNGTYRQARSLYALDVQTRTQITVVPPVPGLLVGNPAFSNTGDRFLTFEAYDQAANVSHIFVADLFLGTVGVVGTTVGQYGYPCFNGDSNAVMYADFDPNVSLLTSIWRQALSFATDTPAANGGRTRWLSNTELGVIYRRGGFPAANVSPTVTLTSPSGTTFTSLASFTLTASASDSDGTVSKVEFYLGSTLVKTDTTSPYTLTGTDFGAGAYKFTARVFDNLGASATSTPLFIRVDPPGGLGRITPGQVKAFELKLGVLQTGVYRIEASTNLVNWTSLGTVQSLDSALNFTDMAATNHPKRFYRAVKLP